MSTTRHAELAHRITEYEQALATFARLHEELTDLRDNVTVPEAGPQIDRMLRVNAETLAAIKQSLALTLAAARRISTNRRPIMHLAVPVATSGGA
jgi:hypothetical protein